MQKTNLWLSESKYSMKAPYGMTPRGIVVHNTANDASAMSEASYMVGNNSNTSFHYAVDHERIVQCIPDNRNAWHCGATYGNLNYLGIETCYSRSGGDRFTQAELNAAYLVALKCKEYGWGIDKVFTHQSQSGKYCPHRTLDLGWNRFLSLVKLYLDGQVGWIWDSNKHKWWYKHEDGSYTIYNWEFIGGKWYFFDKDGWMICKQWLLWKDKWYFFDDSGAMVANKWIWWKNECYYLDSNGVMVADDWQKDKDWWYFLDSQGHMARNCKIEWKGKEYFFNQDGKMVQNVKVTWDKEYFADANGVLSI
ncbi:N-acetylmuramoyl-L-alanine amidase [Lachnospiraceae bacterium LCP25S3_G4]